LAVALHEGSVYIKPMLLQYTTTLLQDKVLFGSEYPALQPDRWLRSSLKNIGP
jgi:uncharacterized protein